MGTTAKGNGNKRQSNEPIYDQRPMKQLYDSLRGCAKEEVKAETKDYARFYAAKGDRYDWDRAPSIPCPRLVGDVLEHLTRRRGDAESCSQMANGK